MLQRATRIEKGRCKLARIVSVRSNRATQYHDLDRPLGEAVAMTGFNRISQRKLDPLDHKFK